MQGAPATNEQRVMAFFEGTRLKGEETFGDGADNLTGIVAVFPNPGPKPQGGGGSAAAALPDRPMALVERDLGDDDEDSDFGV